MSTQPTALKLERALLLTGMMNERFIEMIKDGEVDEEYVTAAFKNFREAQNPSPHRVENEYVLGFMFDKTEEHILLMLKDRPRWQAGFLNGVGGKIEDGETPLQAMQREFTEETGFIAKHYLEVGTTVSLDKTDQSSGVRPDWKLVGTRGRQALFDGQKNSYKMHIFACHFDPTVCETVPTNCTFHDGDGEFIVHRAVVENTEIVMRLPMNAEVFRQRGVPGLSWTIGIALDSLHENFLVDVQDPVNMDHSDGRPSDESPIESHFADLYRALLEGDHELLQAFTRDQNAE